MYIFGVKLWRATGVPSMAWVAPVHLHCTWPPLCHCANPYCKCSCCSPADPLMRVPNLPHRQLISLGSKNRFILANMADASSSGFTAALNLASFLSNGLIFGSAKNFSNSSLFSGSGAMGSAALSSAGTVAAAGRFRTGCSSCWQRVAGRFIAAGMAATTRNYGVQNKVPKLRYAGNDVIHSFIHSAAAKTRVLGRGSGKCATWRNEVSF